MDNNKALVGLIGCILLGSFLVIRSCAVGNDAKMEAEILRHKMNEQYLQDKYEVIEKDLELARDSVKMYEAIAEDLQTKINSKKDGIKRITAVLGKRLDSISVLVDSAQFELLRSNIERGRRKGY